MDMISLRGCRLHNLKNVDAQFPLGKITVVCGPSGCGKSTLVLDTLHGESKRRYLETLSPFACELLGGRRNIPLDSAEGLSASLAIGPSHGEAPAKAYALSISECDSALRTLFAAFAKPACPVCGKPMESISREEIIKQIASRPEGTKLQFFARVPSTGQSLDKLSAVFLAQGYTRAIADGVVYSLADLTDAEKEICPKEFFIVVDRVIVRENTRTRIAEAVDGVLRLTHSHLTLDENGARVEFSTVPCCKEHGAPEMAKTLEAADFSPYSRAAACTCCGGKGIASEDVGDDEDCTECPECGGLRLKKEFLNATIEGITWAEVLTTPFSLLEKKVRELFEGRVKQNLLPTLNSLLDRIEAINELDIGYLTAGRSGVTLSGGEMQRLRLASLSTGHLNGLLIALDEPASGLHHTDVDALWKVLKKVQSRGNTLVLIEHNPGIIAKADWIIEMGPGAGENGGEVLFMGPAKDVLNNPASPTGNWIKYLRGTRAERHPERSAAKSKDLAIPVRDFALFDMKSVSADFPLKKFSVITGQSGSGKSTLMFRNLATRAKAGEFAPLGIDALSILSTGDFHGNRRSTVLSAINMGNLLRDLFAKLPESKVRGYAAGKFATHAAGGRCENCKGEGVILDPSGYEETECPVCLGKRFRDEVLEIRFKSLSIADILDMEIGNAYKLFANMKPFADKLKPLVDTGLDYLRLGQSTAHMSGGERARLRLSIALARAKAPNTLFLFDEPARGLHQVDIQHLLELIKGLTEAGHTVVAIEHAQDFVNAADYVVELSR
ncbi:MULTISPECIES: ABC transporter [unclassified Fibrobacter]|uniref:ABC transporter n=1 Tax=unclassified Fibrobacter TaxID=2634177 RepID=UPI000D6C5F0E|nr:MULTISPECIES: ABC transporter [unclassified Fibrobacter]PWJ59110.1 excinuclease ABC subunit A [Fibrobacter sp. UWR4]PZW62961.1 excinuclease ABC subunit A [Fibrobacter sp. UWR1]